MKAATLYAALFCVATVAFVGWRIHSSRNQVARHAVILTDLSLSHAEGCANLIGLAEQVLQAGGFSPDTMLTVLVAGDAATANEPWRLEAYPIPQTRRVIEGRNATARRQKELLGDIVDKCQAASRPTISPVFLGVKQAVADLRAQGCTENSDCGLYVSSDLEENVEASIQRKLNGSSAKTTLPPPVNNEGIGVFVCGLAAKAGRIVDPSGREIRRAMPQEPGRDDRLRQVWLSLFTRPELVAFAPYCPQSGDL